MKILRLTTFLDFGGIEKRMVNIASVNDDHEWIFCALNKGGTAQKEILDKGKKVYCLNADYKIPSPLTIVKLYKLLKQLKPDVLHSSGAEANFHGMIAGKFAHIPVLIGEEIGVPDQGAVAKIVFTNIYRLADKVVGNSLPVINYLKETHRVTHEKLQLIPNPVLYKSLPERVKDDSTFTLITVSRLVKVKNIQAVLNVTARLLKDGHHLKFVIVGSGPEENSLKAHASALNISEFIDFRGFTQDPYQHLVNADVFVLNSLKEGFSNALLESMYAGIPSVSTKSGSAVELIQHGENGWLVGVDNEEELYKTLKNVISLKPLVREQIGRNAKTFVEKNYLLDKHIHLLLELYQSV